MAKERRGCCSEADTALGKQAELQLSVPEAAIGHRSWTLIHLGRGGSSIWPESQGRSLSRAFRHDLPEKSYPSSNFSLGAPGKQVWPVSHPPWRDSKPRGVALSRAFVLPLFLAHTT
jgi:hypothetical protein